MLGVPPEKALLIVHIRIKISSLIAAHRVHGQSPPQSCKQAVIVVETFGAVWHMSLADHCVGYLISEGCIKRAAVKPHHQQGGYE